MSEDQDIYVGKPSVNELRAYFLNPRWNIMDLNESSSSGSSIDLNESFKQLLEAKMRAAKVNTTNVDEIKRQLPFDDTIIKAESSWCQTTDDSFLSLEKNCENTILNLDNVSLCEEYKDDPQTIIDEFKNKIMKETFVNKFKGQQKLDINDTQINEIEEPSCFWEQTILTEVSPMKQVGLMRPSTIIEEGSITESEKSSFLNNNTVLTAHINESKETSGSSTDHFSTAEDTDYSSNKTKDSVYLFPAKKKNKRFYDSLDSRTHETSDYSTETSVVSTIDGTLATAANDVGSLVKEKETEKVIEISDDDEEEGIEETSNYNIDVKTEDSFANKRRQTLDEVSSIDQDSSPDNSFHLKNNLSDESLINLDSPDTKEKSSLDSSSYNSPKLNDTIDEFDFIIQQGVKMLEEQKTVTPLQNKFLNANKRNEKFKSPGISGINFMHGSPVTPNTVIRKKNVASPLSRQLFSKLSPANSPKTATKPRTPTSFKKPVVPLPTSRIPPPKTYLQKQTNFQHVVSPIGVYIKNNSNLPLKVIDCSEKDIFKSKVMLRYNEEKALKEKEKSKENIFNNSLFRSSQPSLPKKCYISTDNVHLIDKRTNSKLHGGEQMKKLIGVTGTSTVYKHEGRVNTGKYTNKPKELDASLADLSLISGDVSVQVITNAKKF